MRELWTEKYRPECIADVILPARLKQPFVDMVKDGNIPHLMLSGASGVGKTTVAIAMCTELQAEYTIINGSEDGNIETLRTTVRDFASGMSMMPCPYKIVIMDEADKLTSATQHALRGFLEEFSVNCRFIFTCNHKTQIIPALHSRCTSIDFSFTGSELQLMAGTFMSRLCTILDDNSIVYDKKSVAQLIKIHLKSGRPDWRKIINECFRYSVSGKIDNGIFDDIGQSNIDDLLSIMKDMHRDKLRAWVARNSDMNSAEVLVAVFRSLERRDDVKPECLNNLVLIANEYDYKSSFVMDHEINTMAGLTEMMGNLEWL